MVSKWSDGWVMVRQKALRVVVIHTVGRPDLLLRRYWQQALMLHAAGSRAQLLPDVEREVVR